MRAEEEAPVATYRPPSLFGGAPRAPIKSPRPRDASGKPLPPLETRRESASKRDPRAHRWAQCRRRLLAQNPLCASCQKKGLLIPATLVDHIDALFRAFFLDAELAQEGGRCGDL